MRYSLSPADQAPLPATYRTEERYLGYRDEDRAQPWAHHFRDTVAPVQPHVHEALLGGPAPAELGFGIADAAAIMSRPGYTGLETGYTQLDDGQVMVAVHTRMPGVTGEMWDWWFGWHATHTSRYKLWHPGAHYYTGVGEDRSADRDLTDRQRYLGNVSYVDEYLGEKRSPLTVRFFDPGVLGFDPSPPGGTVIAARGGLSTLPVSFAWLIHQVRPTDDGAEMRSRFIVNDFQLLDLPAHSVASRPGRAMTAAPLRAAAGRVLPRVGAVDLRVFGPDMLAHCAQEMNHLATFLPQLYEEFRGTR